MSFRRLRWLNNLHHFKVLLFIFVTVHVLRPKCPNKSARVCIKANVERKVAKHLLWTIIEVWGISTSSNKAFPAWRETDTLSDTNKLSMHVQIDLECFLKFTEKLLCTMNLVNQMSLNIYIFYNWFLSEGILINKNFVKKEESLNDYFQIR